MLGVCPPGSADSTHVSLSSYQPADCAFPVRRIDPRTSISVIPGWSSEYQNPVRNPYGLLPHPPQTQAAPFKRLYRK